MITTKKTQQQKPDRKKNVGSDVRERSHKTPDKEPDHSGGKPKTTWDASALYF